MKDANFTNLANRWVCDLVPYTPGKPIEELERELGINQSIKLASNENPLGASPKAIEAAKEALSSVHLYPDANGFYLKEALSKQHGLPANCITLGNGSNELLVFLAQAFLNPSVGAVYSQYAFAVYPIVTQMMGAMHQEVSALPAEHPMGLGHDLRAMYAEINSNTRIVFIANPNNPTGTWLSSDRLKDFIGALPPHVICVLDEAYTEYSEEPSEASQWIEVYPNLVVTRTFSKAYGLASLRVGFALSHPNIAGLLNRIRPPFNVSGIGLAAALAALDDQSFIAESRRINQLGMDQLQKGLAGLGLATTPSQANFVLAHFPTSVDEINKRLMSDGVIVRPVKNYSLPNALRISVGTQEQNERLLAVLARSL